MFMSETIWSLPCIVWDKIPAREPEKLKAWNKQFYRYCVKKGINPFEYFFDELPIIISTVGLAGGLWRDYKGAYSNNGKMESKEDKKLSADYEHEKQVAEQKEKDIQNGVITSIPDAHAAAPGGS